MKLYFWHIHSIMVIKLYSLTFELILMILAIDKVFQTEEKGFSSNKKKLLITFSEVQLLQLKVGQEKSVTST